MDTIREHRKEVMKNKFYLKKMAVIFLSFVISAAGIGMPVSVLADDIERDVFENDNVLKWEEDNESEGDSVPTEDNAPEEGNKPEEDNEPEESQKPNTNTSTSYKVVMRTGFKSELLLYDIKGAVKWSVSNKKVLKVVSKSNKKCRIKPLKDGTATVTAKAKNKTVKYKVVTKSGKAFVRAWCRQWVKDYISDDMNDMDRLLTASAFITSSRFSYGNTSEAEDVLSKAMGTCVSGGKLLLYMCEAMGFQAKLRFAAKDDMSRYPQGVIMASQHYNVQVNVKGKKYYIDGTPGAGFVYLSVAKKPLFSGLVLNGEIVPLGVY